MSETGGRPASKNGICSGSVLPSSADAAAVVVFVLPYIVVWFYYYTIALSYHTPCYTLPLIKFAFHNS